MMQEYSKYQMNVGGVYFCCQWADNEKQAIEQTKEQIKHLHPINMTDEGAIEYRKRYEGKEITAKKLYSKHI